MLCCKYCGCFYEIKGETYDCCIIEAKHAIMFIGLLGCVCPCHWYGNDKELLEVVKKIFNLQEKRVRRKNKNGI